MIIDNGSYTCKAGFAGQSNPPVEFRPIVGSPRSAASGFGLLYDSRMWEMRHRD